MREEYQRSLQSFFYTQLQNSEEASVGLSGVLEDFFNLIGEVQVDGVLRPVRVELTQTAHPLEGFTRNELVFVHPDDADNRFTVQVETDPTLRDVFVARVMDADEDDEDIFSVDPTQLESNLFDVIALTIDGRDHGDTPSPQLVLEHFNRPDDNQNADVTPEERVELQRFFIGQIDDDLLASQRLYPGAVDENDVIRAARVQLSDRFLSLIRPNAEGIYPDVRVEFQEGGIIEFGPIEGDDNPENNFRIFVEVDGDFLSFRLADTNDANNVGILFAVDGEDYSAFYRVFREHFIELGGEGAENLRDRPFVIHHPFQMRHDAGGDHVQQRAPQQNAFPHEENPNAIQRMFCDRVYHATQQNNDVVNPEMIALGERFLDLITPDEEGNYPDIRIEFQAGGVIEIGPIGNNNPENDFCILVEFEEEYIDFYLMAGDTRNINDALYFYGELPEGAELRTILERNFLVFPAGGEEDSESEDEEDSESENEEDFEDAPQDFVRDQNQIQEFFSDRIELAMQEGRVPAETQELGERFLELIGPDEEGNYPEVRVEFQEGGTIEIGPIGNNNPEDSFHIHVVMQGLFLDFDLFAANGNDDDRIYGRVTALNNQDILDIINRNLFEVGGGDMPQERVVEEQMEGEGMNAGHVFAMPLAEPHLHGELPVANLWIGH